MERDVWAWGLAGPIKYAPCPFSPSSASYSLPNQNFFFFFFFFTIFFFTL